MLTFKLLKLELSSSFETDVDLCSVSLIPLQQRSYSIAFFCQAGLPQRRLLGPKMGNSNV